MNTNDFFIKQLATTRELIEHCFDIMKPERITMAPPHFNHPLVKDRTRLSNSLGEWSALRVLIHLVVYEELIASPEVERFVLNKNSTFDFNSLEKFEEQELLNQTSIPQLLQRFKDVRLKQIELLKLSDDNILNNKVKETLWGKKMLNFVVNKTIQHSLSHGNKLYQKILFWDEIWEYLEKQSLNQG